MRSRRSDWRRIRSGHALVLNGLAEAVAAHPAGSAGGGASRAGGGVDTRHGRRRRLRVIRGGEPDTPPAA